MKKALIFVSIAHIYWEPSRKTKTTYWQLSAVMKIDFCVNVGANTIRVIADRQLEAAAAGGTRAVMDEFCRSRRKSSSLWDFDCVGFISFTVSPGESGWHHLPQILLNLHHTEVCLFYIVQKCDGRVKVPSVNSALGDAVTLRCFTVQFAVLLYNIHLQSCLKKTKTPWQ